MMKMIRWLFPLCTALLGSAAGSWFFSAGWLSSPTDAPLADAKAARTEKSVITVTARAPTAIDASVAEALQEEELLRFWRQNDYRVTVDAFVRYSKQNPARAIELAMNLEGPKAWLLVMELVLTLPPHVSGIAMDALLRHPKYCEACPPLDAVFCLCAKFDLERAWREAHAPCVKFTAAALDAIARSCGEVNPRLAMTLAARLTETKQRDKFTRMVLREWSERDVKGLVTWFGTQEDREKLATQVPWGKLRFDTREDFLAMAKLVPPGLLDGTLGENYSFGTAVEGAWATRLDWLQALPEGETRTALFAGAARALIGADPEKALALLPEITIARLKQQVVSATAAYRAAISPQEGFAFADSLKDESSRKLARQSVIRTWAENDPAAAARYALAEGGEGKDGLLSNLGYKWAELDPQAAASYALAHETADPKAPPYSTLLGSVMSHWVNDDPYTASRWVSELPAGDQRDSAASSLARNAVRNEPDGAMNWAAGISDDALRRQTLESCMWSWASADRARAASWLEQAELDVGTRQALTSAMQATQEQQQRAGSRWNSSNGIIVVY